MVRAWACILSYRTYDMFKGAVCCAPPSDCAKLAIEVPGVLCAAGSPAVPIGTAPNAQLPAFVGARVKVSTAHAFIIRDSYGPILLFPNLPDGTLGWDTGCGLAKPLGRPRSVWGATPGEEMGQQGVH
jgi:hypothetical protein